MPVTKPTTIPRWSSLSPGTSTVQPPLNVGAIPAWAAGVFTAGSLVLRGGNEYTVVAVSGTGTSTTGPVGTGTTIDNPGANQVTWAYVAAVPTTQDSGFQPNTQPPAQYFNWLQYWNYQWILWLQDIANQDFTGGGVGPWAGKHGFTGGDNTGPAIKIQVASTAAAIAGLDATGSAHPGADAGSGVIGRGGAPGAGFSGRGVEGYGARSGPGGWFLGGTDGTTAGGDGIASTGGPSGNGGTFTGGPVPSGGGSAGYGIRCTGGAGQPGLNANGGSGNTPGAICTGSGSGAGCSGIANSGGGGAGGVTGINIGAGPGVWGLSSSGPGGQFSGLIGVQGDTAGGKAGQFTNNGAAGEAINAFSQGSALPAVSITQAGTGPGLDVTSGSVANATVTLENTGGYRCLDVTGTGANPAIQVVNSTVGGTGVSITAPSKKEALTIQQGVIAFKGTDLAVGDTFPINTMGPAHLIKAWAIFTTGGGFGPIAFGGVGISDVSIFLPGMGSPSIQITMRQPMTGAYGILQGAMLDSTYAPMAFMEEPSLFTPTPTQFAVSINDLANSAGRIAVNTHALTIYLAVIGRQ